MPSVFINPKTDFAFKKIFGSKQNKDILTSAILKARQEGWRQGLEEGDRQARITIAKQLLDILDLETIAQKTGLSVEEIEQVRSDSEGRK
jgi:predicted transposase YdaD